MKMQGSVEGILLTQASYFYRDYRAEDYPGRGCNIRHDDDCSVQTLFGHSVSSTLIRAYWSPMHSTGQRFVYTGSADGHIHIFGMSLQCHQYLRARKRRLPSLRLTFDVTDLIVAE